MVAVPNPAMIADATHAQIIRLCMIFCSGSNPAGPNASIRLAATTYTSKLVQICGQFLAKALIYTLVEVTRPAASMGIATR